MKILFISVLMFSVLAGCSGQAIQRKDGSTSERSFSVANLAKTDVDVITEMAQKEAIRSLKLIAEKLYRRNPQEYRKAGMESVEAATARIFEHLDKGKDSPLVLMNWQDNFGLAFQEGYNGDRVYAFMSALTGMVMASYDHKSAFFIGDQLTPQKLYNCARNIEVAVWKLSNAKQATGARVLISNSMEGEIQNLSFEREFGKLVAIQDLMALVIEDRGNRSFTRTLQNVATFRFLPI